MQTKRLRLRSALEKTIVLREVLPEDIHWQPNPPSGLLMKVEVSRGVRLDDVTERNAP